MSNREYVFVMSEPTAGHDAEYNDWYTNVHIPDLVRMPGVTAAQRFKTQERMAGSKALATYLALYEFGDTKRALSEISSRGGTPLMRVDATLDRASVGGHVMALRGERRTAKRVSRGALGVVYLDGIKDAEVMAIVDDVAPLTDEVLLLQRGSQQRMPDPHPAFCVVIANATEKAGRKAWAALVERVGKAGVPAESRSGSFYAALSPRLVDAA
jgi:hypothetical protein